MSDSLNQLAKKIHENAKAHGWWDIPRSVGEIIALIHSELSEGLEEARKDNPAIYFLDKEHNNREVVPLSEHMKVEVASSPERFKPEGLAVELADAIIRILDFSEHMGYDMDHIVALKMRYNETRPYKHGKAF